jgi:Nickel responsive protein SCO4226-like
MSESGTDAAASTAAPLGSAGMFIVERRLPNIDEHQLTVLQAALTSAAARFSARGDGVRYLRSIFLAHQKRLLSLFTAESPEAVRAVNEASLVPFASIEPALELPNVDRP